MARYERVTQIYNILISTREAIPLVSLCASLNASSATVKRLLRFLRDELDTPVAFCRRRGGYLLERDSHPTPPSTLQKYDTKELSSLLAAYEILQNIPPGLIRNKTASLRRHLERLLYQRPNGRADA